MKKFDLSQLSNVSPAPVPAWVQRMNADVAKTGMIRIGDYVRATGSDKAVTFEASPDHMAALRSVRS